LTGGLEGWIVVSFKDDDFAPFAGVEVGGFLLRGFGGDVGVAGDGGGSGGIACHNDKMNEIN
jgi:hypothetical protein